MEDGFDAVTVSLAASELTKRVRIENPDGTQGDIKLSEIEKMLPASTAST